jgi:hypothetical protein
MKKRQQGFRRPAGIRPLGSVLGLAVLALLLVPLGAAAQSEDRSDSIIGVGMAFDETDEAGPAKIAFLYEDLNAGVLAPGDAILEYRGFPVSSGADLYRIVLALPDVAPGDAVDMVIAQARSGEVVAVAPVAAVLVEKTTDATFTDRQCEQSGGDCLCSKVKIGSTCVRTIHTTVDANGKVVSTSSSCVDGVNICPPVPKPKKKGK